MRKYFFALFAIFAVMLMAGCGSSGETDNIGEVAETKTEEVAEPKEEEKTLVAFADLNDDIMDAKENYSLFRFTEPEGTCMEMGFPENLVYKSTNMIMTEDEKYFDEWTAVDFTGMIRFKNVPMAEGVTANCSIKTTTGINTANLVCTSAVEGEEEKELCTGTFKVMAEK